jgi:hypothetical protein
MDMKGSSRLRRPRLSRRDWIGDGVLTLIAGGVLAASVFLPWANDEVPGRVNFSLTHGERLNGVLQTPWGRPALGIALAVLVTGVVMLRVRPRRRAWLLGVLVAALGAAAFGVAQDAAAHIGYFDPGVGMYLTTLVAVLLLPIGLAAALVALFLARAQDAPTGTRDATDSAPATVTPAASPAPPAPENAPPT